MTFDRRCDLPGCPNVFPAARRTARYCSDRCRQAAHRAEDVTLTPEGTTPHDPASGPTKPQVSGGARHANSPISRPGRPGVGQDRLTAAQLALLDGDEPVQARDLWPDMFVSPNVNLPDHLSYNPNDPDNAHRTRWIAILTTPGVTGYPGDCVVPGCKQAQVHVDGLCMAHLIATGKRQKRLP